jgi:hypothetical protein
MHSGLQPSHSHPKPPPQRTTAEAVFQGGLTAAKDTRPIRHEHPEKSGFYEQVIYVKGFSVFLS